jgi:hypothetical protein
LPSKFGVPHAQTFREVFRLLKPEVLEECLASWVAPLQDVARGVIEIDGKTPRGPKKSEDGSGGRCIFSRPAPARPAASVGRPPDAIDELERNSPSGKPLAVAKGLLADMDN